jgi:DNA replication protein DnaC
MSPFDPYDDAALLAAAQELVRTERAEADLRRLLDRRPPAFAEAGQVHPQVQAWVAARLKGQGGSLLLFGAVGTGKTWTIWKAAEALTRGGWTGRFEIAASYELKEATDRPVNRDQLRIWRDADLFAIDDIGAQRINDWDVDALLALIDHRWQHRRPTIIASNELELRGLLGERIASRLVDGATIVTFTGDDHRRARP